MIVRTVLRELPLVFGFIFLCIVDCSSSNAMIPINNKSIYLLESVPNTLFVINDCIRLGRKAITIAPNCTLQFEGKGRFEGGVIVFNNTTINAVENCFSYTTMLKGTIANPSFDFGWFVDCPGKSVTTLFQSAINVCQNSQSVLYIPNGIYLLSPSAVSKDYKETYCLSINKTISIEGESKDQTIIRTVSYDLSRPDGDAYDKNGFCRYGSLFKVKLLENSKITFENITFDGYSKGVFYQYNKQYLGHKCFYSVGSCPANPSLTKFVARNIVVENFESEGLYNESYDISSDYLIENCIFNNNAGSSGNMGGNIRYYKCVFDKANIEHCFNNGNLKWTKERCVISNCEFKNRYPIMCDVGRSSFTRSFQEVKGTEILIDSCSFVKTEELIRILPRKVQASALSVYEADTITINHCVFINASSNQEYGSSCINIRKNALNIRIRDNSFICTAPFSVFRIMVNKDSNIQSFESKGNCVESRSNMGVIYRNAGNFKLNLTEIKTTNDSNAYFAN